MHAFIYSGGQLIDLNDLIDPASGGPPARLRDQRQLYCRAGFLNGVGRGFLLKLLAGDANLDARSMWTIWPGSSPTSIGATWRGPTATSTATAPLTSTI